MGLRLGLRLNRCEGDLARTAHKESAKDPAGHVGVLLLANHAILHLSLPLQHGELDVLPLACHAICQQREGRQFLEHCALLVQRLRDRLDLLGEPHLPGVCQLSPELDWVGERP